jgi:hypothetical protein
MLVVICPSFSSIYFCKTENLDKEGPKPLCSTAILAKSSSNLPIMEKKYQKFH